MLPRPRGERERRRRKLRNRLECRLGRQRLFERALAVSLHSARPIPSARWLTRLAPPEARRCLVRRHHSLGPELDSVRAQRTRAPGHYRVRDHPAASAPKDGLRLRFLAIRRRRHPRCCAGRNPLRGPRDPYSSEYAGHGSNDVHAGFRWTGGGRVKNVLVEGCRFEFYNSNFVMHPSNGEPMFENVRVSGNVLYSAW